MNQGHDNAPSQHTIRLRGPCKLLWMRNGTQQAEVRVRIPCEIGPNLFELSEISANDTFVLRRNFGKPAGLEDSQSVTLELTGFQGASRVVVNRETETEVASEIANEVVSLDLTSSLRMQNRFEVEFDSLPAVVGEVQLVIV